MVRGLPSAKRRGKGRAGAGSTHAAPLFSSWLVHPPEQPTAARPDTHISIFRAPASTCPSSPTSSFTNLCLPPGWLMFGTTVPPCLRKCWQEQCQISPNEPYLCQRLRKEFRLEFLLPSCQVLACHTAPPHLLPSACQPGGHLQGRAASLGAQGMGQSTLHPCALRPWAGRPWSWCPQIRDSGKQEVGGLHSSIPASHNSGEDHLPVEVSSLLAQKNDTEE